MTLKKLGTLAAILCAAACTVAAAQAPRGPRTDTPRHIRQSARNEEWIRRRSRREARQRVVWRGSGGLCKILNDDYSRYIFSK